MSFGEQIYHTLKERILNNYYAPGVMLQIDKLAEEMGVSSTPIRETLFKLHNIGLVKMIRNKGALVSDIDEKMARNVWQFRALLEISAAREAVPHIDVSHVSLIKGEIERCLQDPSNFELYQKTDRELHLLICDNAENDLVKEALKNLMDHSRRVRYFAESIPLLDNILTEISNEHLIIVESLLTRNVDKVVEALTLHLSQAEERTLCALSNLREEKMTVADQP